MAAPNNPYPALSHAVDPAIVRSIKLASHGSGSDFGLLMAEAQQESGFRPDAKSARGSAAGMFQFTDSTWLDMVRRCGAKYGLGTMAQQIGTDAAGKPTVDDAATRQHILALRSDPNISASLAGEFAQMNKSEVERALGRSAGTADLYMAHFLGAGGATQFLKALDTNGATPAAALLPDAAASNRGVFYDAAGRAKSVAEIYRSLGGKIEQAASSFAQLVEGGAAPAAGTASAPALPSGAAGATRPFGLGLAVLRLTAPVSAILDTLSAAALNLISKVTTPHTTRRS